MSSAMNSERMPNITTINVGTQAASISLPAMAFRKKARIKEVRYIDQAGVAADNTNYLQLSLQAGATVIATLDTRSAHDGALTALVSKIMALASSSSDSASQPEFEIAAGTDLKIVVTKNGTGVPTLGQLQIEHYPL